MIRGKSVALGKEAMKYYQSRAITEGNFLNAGRILTALTRQIVEESAKAALDPLLVNFKDESRFDTARAMFGGVEVYDPVHRVRPAVAAAAMGIQRHLLQAADAQPLPPDWLTRLRAAEREAEHESEHKQRLGQ